MKSIQQISFRSTSGISIVTILFGMLLLCFIWGGLYYKVQSERQLELDNAVKETGNYARAFAEHTARTIRGLDEVMKFLKYKAEKEGLAVDLPGLVQARQFEGQPFVALAILNENGDLVAASQTPAGHINNRDREVFRVHQREDNGKVFIEKPLPGRITGKTAIHLSRRINKSDGSFGGVVVAAIDPYYFVEFYQQVDLGEQSLIALVRLDGILLLRQTGDFIQMGLDLSQEKLIKLAADIKVGSYISVSPFEGFTRIRSYRVMDDYPLIVLVGVAEEHVLRNFKQRVTGYYELCMVMSAIIGVFVGLILVDVRRRKQTEEALAEKGAFLNNLLDALPLPVFYKDTAGRYLGVNKAFEIWHGRTNQEIVGKKVWDIAPPELAQGYHDKDQAVLCGQGGQTYESWIDDAAGVRHDVVFHKAAFADTQGTIRGLIGAILDITEHKRLENELLKQATTDGLTGVLNRRHFLQRGMEELERIHRYGGSAVLLLLDIDHFKSINDRFGHSAGDAALREFAAVCRQVLRDSDLLGRVGGEEFAALLVECSLDCGLSIAERLRRIVEATVVVVSDGLQIRFTVSIGAAECRREDTIMALLGRADAAMYQAKAQGRNRIVAAEGEGADREGQSE